MRILMINKFLHPNGESETYMFRLGECLKKMDMKFSILEWSMKDAVLEMLSMCTRL